MVRYPVKEKWYVHTLETDNSHTLICEAIFKIEPTSWDTLYQSWCFVILAFFSWLCFLAKEKACQDTSTII